MALRLTIDELAPPAPKSGPLVLLPKTPWWDTDEIQSRNIAGARVDGTCYANAIDQVTAWADARESRYVCISTVHMVMEGHDNPAYQAIVNGADLVTSDGMPLVWGLRALGAKSAERVYGPDLTPMICERAAAEGISVGFYGSTEVVLSTMVRELNDRYPDLQVVYQHSPPFRTLTDDEVAEEIAQIRSSGVQILFVGLGCPKQERWMASRRGEIDAVMLGVGAAFDYVGGTKAQAPKRMQSMGLEWLFRLITEPKRLWKRYLYHNPRFVALFGSQLLGSIIGGARK
jgi:N-acetylglucosaminyldiphosphoundecaprenol N-acetyl-beta-D-mannosaminyltransferase